MAKIVIAPDSFKGSLSAARVAEAIGEGVRRALPQAEVALVPLADGGEGTVEAFVTAVGGRIVPVTAIGPLEEPTDAFIGMIDSGKTAVIEMAAASGLPLVPEDRRNPMLTTSYGTGELIRTALDFKFDRIILGIGGSATNDGGVGMIQALGGSFKDGAGKEVGFGGGELRRVRSIDLTNLDARLKTARITVACDVENPLTGPNGASAVFGPQKGATAEMIELLDAGLRNLADVIRRDVGVDIEKTPGSGAAGGMGAAALAFLGVELKPGIDIVLDAARFNEKLDGADLMFTGEGRVDSQTMNGKCVSGVMRVARSRGVPVIVLAGGVEPDGYQLLEHGALAVLSIVDGPMTLAEAQERTAEFLARAAEQAVRLGVHPRIKVPAWKSLRC